jgi:hypothetical protein
MTPVSASTVRISHLWYDGPQVALEVSQNGAWVPYGDSDIAADIDAWAACVGDEESFLDSCDWPAGRYRFADGIMTPSVLDKPMEARRG